MVVVDAHVFAFRVFPYPLTEEAERLAKADPDWVVPGLTRHELLNILALRMLEGEMTLSQAQRALPKLMALVDGRECHVDTAAALALANERNISAPDAVYVTLAKSLHVPFATQDARVLRKCPDVAREMAAHTQKRMDDGFPGPNRWSLEQAGRAMRRWHAGQRRIASQAGPCQLVADASAVIRSLAPAESVGGDALAGQDWAVPEVCQHDLARLLRRSVRRGEMTSQAAERQCAEGLKLVNGREHHVDMPTVLRTSHDVGINAYKAQHVTLAREAHCHLLTSELEALAKAPDCARPI